MGHHVHDSPHTEQVSRALKVALKRRWMQQMFVRHSDRGIPYGSNDDQEIHRRHGIACSLTDGYQNARAERVNGILKMELRLHRPADLRPASRMGRAGSAALQPREAAPIPRLRMPDEVHRGALLQSNTFKRQYAL